MESDGIFFFRNTGFLHEGSDGFEALGAIAGGVRGAGSFAAVLGREAMATRGIGFAKITLKKTMETKKQVIEALVQVVLDACDKGVDVVRVIEEGRLNLDAHFRHDCSCDFFDAFDRSFEAGHRVMRKEWNE